MNAKEIAILGVMALLGCAANAPHLERTAVQDASSSEQRVAKSLGHYAVFDVGTLNGGDTKGYGINNTGQVVGESGGYAFLYTPSLGIKALGTTIGPSDLRRAVAINDVAAIVGETRGRRLFLGTVESGFRFGPPIANASAAVEGINQAGNAVGTALVTGRSAAVVMRADGSVAQLMPTESSGNAINDSGWITGTARKSPDSLIWGIRGRFQAFIYAPGARPIDIDIWRCNDSEGYALNKTGQVTGFCAPDNESPMRAFVYTPNKGAVVLKPLPGYGASIGRSINDEGQVVGNLFNGLEEGVRGDRPPHPFIYSEGTGLVDLNALIPPDSGWELINARGINNSGEIVGWGRVSGATHGYLLVPNKN